MIDLYNTLLEFSKSESCTRNHADNADSTRGAFGGKPNVQHIKR